jgi:hypothetical protein
MPAVSVRSANVALLVKVRAQRWQRRSPQGRPATCCSLSGVVRQMGHTRSKVVPLPLLLLLAAVLAAGPDATAAPPVLLPLGSCADCCTACTLKR